MVTKFTRKHLGEGVETTMETKEPAPKEEAPKRKPIVTGGQPAQPVIAELSKLTQSKRSLTPPEQLIKSKIKSFEIKREQ